MNRAVSSTRASAAFRQPCRSSENDILVGTTSIVVVDVETTGLDSRYDSVVQIAACRLDSDDEFCSYVKPDTAMSASALAIHGLSAHELRRAPTITEVIRDFDRYAGTGSLLCGHNVAFDAAFIREAYAKANIPYRFDYHILDVWSISFFILSAQKREQTNLYRLQDLCQMYDIRRGMQHDALEDVRATKEVLHKMWKLIEDR